MAGKRPIERKRPAIEAAAKPIKRHSIANMFDGAIMKVRRLVSITLTMVAAIALSYCLYYWLLVGEYNRQIKEDAYAQLIAELKDKIDEVNTAARAVIVDPTLLADTEAAVLSTITAGGWQPFAVAVGFAIIFSFMAVGAPAVLKEKGKE